MAPFDVITFDCYGTLIDWEKGISNAFLRAAREHVVQLDPEELLATYARVEPAVQARSFQPYRDVLIGAAIEAAGRLGWIIDRETARFLPDSLPSWPPFEDTNDALKRLAERHLVLGILSNVDDDLLTQTRRHLEVEFAIVVTAQQVRTYKPAPGHFRRAAELIGGHRWLHVAQSYFHDIEPAVEMGIPVAWVNRKNERLTGDARPLREVSDLRELAEWLLTAQT